MEKTIQFLESIGEMSGQLKSHLTSILKSKEISKKDYLLKAGHVCQNIYFIDKGLLRRFYYIREDTEISSCFMKEGDVVISGESFLKQIKSYESIQALEDCRLHYLHYSEIQYIYRHFPEFNFIARVVLEKSYMRGYQKSIGLHMRTPGERYQWLLQNHQELLLRVSSKYLASYIGISEVTLSRQKGKRNFLSRDNPSRLCRDISLSGNPTP